MNTLIEFVSLYKYHLMIAALAVLILVFVAFRRVRKRKLKHRFDELEVRYNELMSIPILFKINKVNGLAKMNPSVVDTVTECKAGYDELRRQQEEIARVLADTEDSIAFNKQKEARLNLSDLEIMVDEALHFTHQLSDDLDKLLEQETQQRMEITEAKERFRNVKGDAQRQAASLGDSYEHFEERFREVEGLFSSFEEWMYASDFIKAQQTSETINDHIINLAQDLKRVPMMYETAKGYLPSLLGDVSKLFQDVRQSGAYVEHLEVTKNIGVLSEILKEDLLRLRQGQFDETETSLQNSVKRLEQLALELGKERRAHDELDQKKDDIFDLVDQLHDVINRLDNDRQRIQKRFKFEGFSDKLDTMKAQSDTYRTHKVKLIRMIEEEKIPSSTILVSLKELEQDSKMLFESFKSLNDMVEQANADEVRARNQLLKLYLIMNDVQIRIKRRSIASISDTYESDLVKAYHYTDQVKELLNQEILDVKLLNATVEEAIDYIYKLHNNINNLVGVVDMCENAIVFANKYRAYVPDIDAELTRAEIAFNNGEYTQSLAMVIKAIDRYRPNASYEEMIRNNAKSAR